MEKPRRLLPNELDEMKQEEFDWLHLKTIQDMHTAIIEDTPPAYRHILAKNLTQINKFIAKNQGVN